MQIYLFHTQFNEKYIEDIENEEFKIESSISGVSGFGKSYSIAQVHYSNGLHINFDDAISKPSDVDTLVIIVSDQKYSEVNNNQPLNRMAIENKLSELISDIDKVNLIFHDNIKFINFKEYVDKSFQNQLRSIIGAKHLIQSEASDYKSYPYYSLVHLINSATADEYNKALGKLKSFFPSEKEIELSNKRRAKIILLNKVISQSYRLQEEDIKQLSVFLPDFDIKSYSSSNDKIKELRDCLLNNEI